MAPSHARAARKNALGRVGQGYMWGWPLSSKTGIQGADGVQLPGRQHCGVRHASASRPCGSQRTHVRIETPCALYQYQQGVWRPAQSAASRRDSNPVGFTRRDRRNLGRSFHRPRTRGCRRRYARPVDRQSLGSYAGDIPARTIRSAMRMRPASHCTLSAVSSATTPWNIRMAPESTSSRRRLRPGVTILVEYNSL